MIAFVSGVLATLLLPHLPPLWFALFAAGMAALLLAVGYARISTRNSVRSALQCQLLWLMAGFACGVLQGHWRLASIIPSHAEQKDIALTGFITGLPQCRRQWGQQQCKFDVDVVSATVAVRMADGKQLADSKQPALKPLTLKRVQLTQYGAAAVDVGACVALTVRLKRPHGLFNAGSIDFEAAKLRSGIDATGYVRAVRNAECVDGLAALRWWPARRIAIARTAIRNAVIARFDGSANSGLVLALVLGDYSLVDRRQWGLFNATGTQHLVTVSGLHIGIAAMLGYGFGSLLALPFRRSGMRRQHVAAASAWLVALAYALLAGGSTPTLRSLLMLSLFLLLRLLRRESGIGATLWAAFAAIVIADPLAATSIGFWLSFGAVAVLMAGLQWRRQRFGFISNLVAPQWVVFVGLAPLLLACFGQLPLVSMLANLLAVPWSSFVLMPALLFSTLCGFAQPALNTLVTTALDYLCLWLMWCRNLPVTALSLPSESTVPSIIALALAAVFFLLPRGLWLRPQALVLIAAMALSASDQSSPGSRGPAAGVSMDVFDVGQGLAVLVSNGDHHLLFDTGAAWGDDFDAAQIAVLPFLRSRGIENLDALIVSHADMDHAGGVRSVLDAVRVDRIFAGEPVVAAASAQPCASGQRWNLGDAQLTMLHPLVGSRTDGNNASCVLLIEYRGRRLLLTGDIEAPAERALLADALAGQALAAGVDVLVAPHHGSHSSSTAEFLRRMHPVHVVFAVGYRNRYGHPHADIVERYRRLGSVIHRSDRDGMIRFHVDPEGALEAIRWRERWRRYWFMDDGL